MCVHIYIFIYICTHTERKSKYQTAWQGIKGISAVQRSGDGKRLLPDGLSSAGGSWSLHRGGRTQGCGAQWGCSKMTFHIQIRHSNGIWATFKTARMASLTVCAEFFSGPPVSLCHLWRFIPVSQHKAQRQHCARVEPKTPQ